MRVLVTGGAGYIGSHTCKQLSLAGIEPIVYDNLSRGHRRNVKWGPLVVGDILDPEALDQAFEKYKPDACIHFAAYAYVGESIEVPDVYYRNNVGGTLSLITAMHRAGVDRLVFSSSCATYGVPEHIPITEDTDQKPINPYGASKLMSERMIDDVSKSFDIAYACLRYFNACGADIDGDLQEDHEPETHLIPRCLMAAAGLIAHVDIFGNDYATPDGTCIRDYIHVADLAEGHVLALQDIMKERRSFTLNLGTGKGYSIREILDEIHQTIGIAVPYKMRERRMGDPPVLVADCKLASEMIAFKASRSDLQTIIRTASRKYAIC